MNATEHNDITGINERLDRRDALERLFVRLTAGVAVMAAGFVINLGVKVATLETQQDSQIESVNRLITITDSLMQGLAKIDSNGDKLDRIDASVAELSKAIATLERRQYEAQ